MRQLMAIVILACFAHVAYAETPKAAACTVNVNTATVEQLKMLIRTGDVLAERIIAARPLNAAKLDAVKGVGTAWLEQNGPHVTFEGETTCNAKLKAVEPPKKPDTSQPVA